LVFGFWLLGFFGASGRRARFRRRFIFSLCVSSLGVHLFSGVVNVVVIVIIVI
jgi:hypothetical protein